MDPTFIETALTRNAVIFDFDGVLAKIHVDWPALKMELRQLIADHLGQCEKLTPFDLQLNSILETAPASLIAKVNQTIASYELADFDRHLVFPEMLTTAKRLADEGITLFICSSNTRVVIEQILKGVNMLGCFRQIVSREDVSQRKPDPEGVLKILAGHGLRPEDVLFIGDRGIDQCAGDATGIQTIIVTPGNSQLVQASQTS